jgi:glycolate oxidase
VPSADGALLGALTDSLPTDSLITDPEILESYRFDQATFVDAGIPAAVVRASSTAQVQDVMRVASRFRTPIVPRGAGSGLSGGANAVDGCVVLSLASMTRIVDIDRPSLLALVEPGVVNAELKKDAGELGLAYPPDPASAEFSTLGGNIATNAGGLCCVKYGVTREYVLGLEVVLADGSVLRTGRRSIKGVAGYDLTALFVGSEGTLGVITGATLRLRPAPEPPATLVAFFADLKAAGSAIREIVAELTPSILEVMDRTTVRAVEEWKHMGLDVDAAAMVLARSDAGGDRSNQEIEVMARACLSAGATDVTRSTDATESEMLMTARRLASPALDRHGAKMLDDVAVPLGRIPDLLQTIEGVASSQGVTIATFGHAGDGNLHPTILFDPADEAARARARSAFDEILRATLGLGGTITGEHGVGLLKRSYLGGEIGGEAMRVHAKLKKAMDPQGILNPGKILQ